MTQSTSIIIPHYEKWEMTHNLLADIYRHERGNVDEIVLVNNGGTSKDVEMGQRYWRDVYGMLDSDAVKIVDLPENRGFLLAANLGLQEAEGMLKILISNDVRIHGTFIQQIKDILWGANRRKLVGQKLYVQSTGWNDFEGKIFPYLEGFFLAASYGAWEDFGYFDPRYSPCDYEDVDLSTTAINKGYELVPLNFPYIQHLCAGTYGYNPEREIITVANRKKFRAKWIDYANQHKAE